MHVHCLKASAVVIPRLFATAVPDAFLPRAPLVPAAVDVVFSRLHTRARGHGRWHPWCDGPLWDVGQHGNAPRSPTLAHPAARWLLGCQWPAAALALQASPPAAPPFVTTASGFPLGPATMATSSPATSSVHLGGGLAHEAWAHLAWPLLHVVLIESACVGNLRVRQGEPHARQTPSPHPQGLRVTGKERGRQIGKAARAGLAQGALTLGLRVIVPWVRDLKTRTPWTREAVWPA